MEEDTKVTVPYVVFEGSQARLERTIKRMFILICILIAALLFTNAAWLYAWNSYETVYEEVDLDAGNGNANYVGRDLSGVINNGED